MSLTSVVSHNSFCKEKCYNSGDTKQNTNWESITKCSSQQKCFALICEWWKRNFISHFSRKRRRTKNKREKEKSVSEQMQYQMEMMNYGNFCCAATENVIKQPAIITFYVSYSFSDSVTQIKLHHSKWQMKWMSWHQCVEHECAALLRVLRLMVVLFARKWASVTFYVQKMIK